MTPFTYTCTVVLLSGLFTLGVEAAQQVSGQRPAAPAPTAQGAKPDPKAAAQQPAAVSGAVPAGYVIGPDDALGVLFWRDKDMSVEQTVVRPDGMITLPLLNDIRAAGLTPDQFREAIVKAASQFIEDPNVTVVIKQINSRKVYVTGAVLKPGSFSLTTPTTVMQALAMAGGLSEFAKKDNVAVIRITNGKTQRLRFNYNDVLDGKKLEQNIELKPGDTVVVPD
ncbi:MAG: polysaccharide biosynthesis/export family protein [Vicinamibacterales bacterium]